MIVCHCNVITRSEIEKVVDRLLEEDPHCVITPGRIYHRLGKRGRCCNCFPLVVDILVARVEQDRAKGGTTLPEKQAIALGEVA